MWPSIQQLKDFEGIGTSSSRDERIIRENGWIRKMKKGDEAAFEELYRYYYPLLGQFLMRYVDSGKTAEDLIHNVFYKVWENRCQLEPRGTLRAYLYTSVRNQALNHIQKEKNRKQSDLEDHPFLAGERLHAEENIEYKEFKSAVLETIEQLPASRRNIFRMHREDKLTYREIAEVLDISIKTVETQMSRSIRFLTDKLSRFRDH